MKKKKVNQNNRKWLRRMTDCLERHMSASQIMMAGFAALIFCGSILLALPICNADGKWLNYLDALFTACTAVCVTGLVTIVPAVQFNLPGKIVLLILIQLGGFGIIVCTMGIFLLLRRQITVRDRVMLQASFNLTTMRGLVQMLRYVIRGTFLVEGIGALFYSIQFVPEYGFLCGICYGIFHAVSAFCNAGIDLLGENSLEMYQTNLLINLTTIVLILLSGLGFLVWQDLLNTICRIWKKEDTLRRCLRKMKLQTKLVVVMTLILFFGGTLVIFCMEYSNPDTFGTLSFWEKWLAAMFQAVTTRTAGFFTIPQGLFREQTKLFSCILMFIGGSPGGTAGGVKTTTVAVLLLTCWSVLKGMQDTEVMGRKIKAATVRTAFSIFTVSFLALLAGTMALVALEQIPLMDALYEAVSAVATVGLSVGITSSLGMMGKLVLILLMYLGRIGPVTMAILFADKLGKRRIKRKLPEEQIMVG